MHVFLRAAAHKIGVRMLKGHTDARKNKNDERHQAMDITPAYYQLYNKINNHIALTYTKHKKRLFPLALNIISYQKFSS